MYLPSKQKLFLRSRAPLDGVDLLVVLLQVVHARCLAHLPDLTPKRHQNKTNPAPSEHGHYTIAVVTNACTQSYSHRRQVNGKHIYYLRTMPGPSSISDTKRVTKITRIYHSGRRKYTHAITQSYCHQRQKKNDKHIYYLRKKSGPSSAKFATKHHTKRTRYVFTPN